MLLKELPILERPREKALKYGIESLNNAELLSILLRTGNKEESALTLGNKILTTIESIKDLKETTISELIQIKGIGNTKAITLLAAVELGNRILNDSRDEISFETSEQVYQYMKYRVKDLTEEHLYALYLNSKGLLIHCKLLTKGNINSTIIDGKLIFKWAYKLSATAIILVHNHPSGDSTPSLADLKYTETVVKQAELMGLIVIDHIIIGKDYYSMKKNNKCFKLF